MKIIDRLCMSAMLMLGVTHIGYLLSENGVAAVVVFVPFMIIDCVWIIPNWSDE